MVHTENISGVTRKNIIDLFKNGIINNSWLIEDFIYWIYVNNIDTKSLIFTLKQFHVPSVASNSGWHYEYVCDYTKTQCIQTKSVLLFQNLHTLFDSLPPFLKWNGTIRYKHYRMDFLFG